MSAGPSPDPQKTKARKAEPDSDMGATIPDASRPPLRTVTAAAKGASGVGKAVARGATASKVPLSLPDFEAASRPFENLDSDLVLQNAPRQDVQGQSVPVLGGIALLCKLGQGGMGSVYFGLHPRLRQEVAVKVLPFALIAQNEVMIERFYREAQMAAKVKSPHIVGVLDVNEEAGLFYLVMEYVAGVTTAQYAKNYGPRANGLPEEIALKICIAAAKGLNTAHAEGIIHRDLKPDNILIPQGKNGEALIDQAKLADLGLARTDEASGSLTGGQTAMGTPGFMSPEQALDAKEARKPTDVFSLGATLYDLLCGRPPFGAKSLTQTVMDTIQKRHVGPENFRPDLSPATLNLIERCLKKEPAKRPEDGAAVLALLEAALAALPNKGKQARLGSGPITVPTTPARGTAMTLVESSGGPPPVRFTTVPEREAPPRTRRVESGGWVRPALFGIGAIVFLVGAWYFWPRIKDPFLSEREKVLNESRPALKSDPESIKRAVAALDEFQRVNGDRSAEDLEPIKNLDNLLHARQAELSERANRFQAGMADARRLIDADPAASIKRFDEMEQLGQADAEKSYPDLVSGLVPSLAAQRAAARERLQSRTQPMQTPDKSASPALPNETPYNRAMREGMAAVHKSDFKAAAYWFGKALDENPDDEAAAKNLQQAQQALNELGGNHVEKKGTKILDAIKLAQESQRGGDPTMAVAVLEEALKLGQGTGEEREIAQNLLQQLREDAKRRALFDAKVREAEQAQAAGKFEEGKKLLYEARLLTNQANLQQKVDGMLKILDGAYHEQKYQKAMDEGQRLQADKNYGGAVQAYTKALQEKPDDEAAQDAIKECKQKLGYNSGNPKRPPK